MLLYVCNSIRTQRHLTHKKIINYFHLPYSLFLIHCHFHWCLFVFCLLLSYLSIVMQNSSHNGKKTRNNQRKKDILLAKLFCLQNRETKLKKHSFICGNSTTHARGHRLCSTTQTQTSKHQE